MTQHYLLNPVVLAWPVFNASLEDDCSEYHFDVKMPDGKFISIEGEQFLASSVPLGHLSNLEEWQARLWAEHEELRLRLLKLDRFIQAQQDKKPADRVLGFNLLQTQQSHMRDYLTCLSHRLTLHRIVEIQKERDPEDIYSVPQNNA